MDYPKVKVCLDTSEDNLIDELYTPCLKWAERFDRGVGYFTTGWLTYNVAGLSDFASRGGKMRLITSPILSTEDTDAIIGAENQDGSAFLRLEAALLENVEILKQEMEADIINTFSWMLYDGIIDMRFAIPCEKLEEGDFHDKFGIFYKGNDALSFSGSINDSKHGFQNYESIKVFKTWLVHRSMSMRIPLVSRKSGIEKTAISKCLPFHKQLKTKYLNCVPRIGRILCRQVRVNGFIRT